MTDKKRERGIIFSAPMVRAILSGANGQTRRIVKPQPPAGWESATWMFPGCMGWTPDPPPSATWHQVRCPYGDVGDRLWVRETWQAWHRVSVEYDEWEPITREARSGERWASWVEIRGKPDSIEYRATSESQGPWTPAIHMPRWASRITLEVTCVRVERLQAITEADAKAEGVIPNPQLYDRIRPSFAVLWDEINGADSWAANPWVWVVDFKRPDPTP